MRLRRQWRRKRKLFISYILILAILFGILSFKNIKVSASVNIFITKTEYNTETACWGFTINASNSKNIYYTYKNNEEISKNCKYVKSGEKISISSSLIKNSCSIVLNEIVLTLTLYNQACSENHTLRPGGNNE